VSPGRRGHELERRLLRDLDGFLKKAAGQGSPDYLDHVLSQAAVTPQRPAWSSLGWWLRIDTASVGQRAFVRRVAWVAVGALALVALVGGLLLAGSQRRPPLPFGLAANGAIAIANQDSIIVADADGTNARVLVAARDGVEDLTWSPDGTRLAYRTLNRATDLLAIPRVDAVGRSAVGGRDGSETQLVPGIRPPSGRHGTAAPQSAWPSCSGVLVTWNRSEPSILAV
jgi:hypothetical protein